jgi:hypothetical protein
MRATRALVTAAVRGIVFGVGFSLPAAAQNGARADSTAQTLFLPVGSPAENYLRYAQTLGLVPLTPWTVRALTPAQVDMLGTRASLSGAREPRRIGDLTWQLLPVSGTLWYNSTYPYGWNDGAVWRGRGATAALDGGIALRWKAFSATVDPIAFVAENRGFPLMAVSRPTSSQFADPAFPNNIDRPQRFGDRTYAHLRRTLI